MREELRHLRQLPEIFITHLKPLHAELIEEKISGDDDKLRLGVLHGDQIFDF